MVLLSGCGVVLMYKIGRRLAVGVAAMWERMWDLGAHGEQAQVQCSVRGGSF